MTWYRRPPFGRHGRAVVVGLCGWEIVALFSPLPTLSRTVRLHHWFGILLLLALGHHWFVEADGANLVP